MLTYTFVSEYLHNIIRNEKRCFPGNSRPHAQRDHKPGGLPVAEPEFYC